MKIELAPDVALWVKAEVASGRFLTAEDAVRYAINQVKIMELRTALDAAEAEGGEYTSDEVREYVYAYLDRAKQTPGR
jgi:Arc/MetJ-type ribon-helix-helix transcriptional regulator